MKIWVWRIAFCLVLGLNSLASFVTAANAAQEFSSQNTETQIFSITPQPLSKALLKFAEQSNLEVLFDTRMTQHKNSLGIKGEYSQEQALRELLTGTGLDYRFTGTKAVTLVRESQPIRAAPSRTAPQQQSLPLEAEQSMKMKAIKLREVVVLGDKLNRPMEDIPQSVTTFEAEPILRQANTTSAQEVFYRTPNVTVGVPAGGSFQIRGVGNNNVVRNTDTGSNGSITVFSNLMPISFSTYDYAPPSLWDVKSVEIFKGPQSTTQGPNSLAGAVLFNYQEPEFNYEGRTRVTWGTFNTLNAAIAQNVPLIDDVLGLRFSYEKQSSDGAIHNPTLDIDDFAEVDRNTFRGQALFRPSKSKEIEAKLTVTYDHARDNASSPSHGQTTSFFLRQNTSENRNRDEIDAATVGLVVNAQLTNSLKLTTISGFNRLDNRLLFDATGTPDPSEGVVDFFRTENIGSQEVRVNYDSGPLRAVFGVFGQYGSYDSGFDFNIPASGTFVKSILDERYNVAIFGDAEYDLTNRISIGGGLRVHHENYEITMGQNVFGAGFADDSTKASDTVPLPKAHITYQLIDPLKVGILVARGFRSGGGSVTYSPQAVASTSSYDPEYTWNYEVFFRSVWFEGQLLVNGNGFFTDWEDMIVGIPRPAAFNTTDTVTVNAASAEIYGFELEAVYSPSSEISFPIALGYTHTKFTDFELSPGMNIAGQAFPNAPSWTFSIGVDYQAQNGWFATSTFAYRDSTYYAVNTPGPTALESRELLSAKAGYAGEHWSAYVFGSNLLDDDYATVRFVGSASTSGQSGLPRTIGFGLEGYW